MGRVAVVVACMVIMLGVSSLLSMFMSEDSGAGWRGAVKDGQRYRDTRFSWLHNVC